MTTTQYTLDRTRGAEHVGENPFADPVGTTDPLGPASAKPVELPARMPLDSPFGDESAPPAPDQFRTALSQAFSELHDDAFDEAVTALVTETEALVGERFTGEVPEVGDEMRRVGEAHLAPVGLAAQHYVEQLRSGVEGLDLESLGEHELDELLDRFDPEPVDLSPAAEQFFGGWVKKAKKAVKSVVKTAKKVAGRALGPLVNAALSRLRRWATPLLKRVLEFAINKLPAPLQGPARTLARRYGLEAESLEADDDGRSPAMPTDPESLAEAFDKALAADLMAQTTGSGEPESFAETDDDAVAGSQITQLAAARRELAEMIRTADDEADLTPAVEQFVPALLAALRIGIKLATRPKVVDYLAGYVGRLIRRWVGPQLAPPLAKAVVDAGLRLMQLEQTAVVEDTAETVPVLLAGTIEDTIRRVAEQDELLLDDENLARIVVAEAFEQAVAATFPPTLVRPTVRQAPTLGGFFMTRGARTAHPYRRYTRAPEVEITEHSARDIVTFGGLPLAARLGPAGDGRGRRYRVQVYEAVAGSTLRHLARSERMLLGPGATGVSLTQVHPLTSHAAAILLHEPRLGVDVPAAYLATPGRIAVGQRFYALVPADAPAAAQAESAPVRPTTRRVVVDPREATVTATVYLSEPAAQELVTAVRAGRGVSALLKALLGGLNGAGQPDPELESEGSVTAPLSETVVPVLARRLRRRVQVWLATAVSGWAAQRSEEFVRAALDPAQGVTVRIVLSGVPGLEHVAAARDGRLTPGARDDVVIGRAFAAAPASTVIVQPGRADS